jgi:hypothetical protein
MYIQGVSKMLGQVSGVSSSHQNKDMSDMSTNGFRGTASTFARSQSFRFLSVGTFKTRNYSASIESEETLHELIFYACQTVLNRAGTFERVRQSIIRSARACIGSGGGYLEHLL